MARRVVPSFLLGLLALPGGLSAQPPVSPDAYRALADDLLRELIDRGNLGVRYRGRDAGLEPILTTLVTALAKGGVS